MLELYDIDELNIIDGYQQEDTVLLEKLNSAEYQKGSFRGVMNALKLIPDQDKIVIAQKLQRYVANREISVFSM